jgi:hypothetical protein
LGKINFLRRFISNFADLFKHIIAMIRNGREVKQNFEEQDSFDQIKNKDFFIFPDYSKEFFIFSFSSSDTLALRFVIEKYKGVREAYLFL